MIGYQKVDLIWIQKLNFETKNPCSYYTFNKHYGTLCFPSYKITNLQIIIRVFEQKCSSY